MDRLLTLKETENLLNVSKSTLQRWDRTGKLVAIRTEGGHRRYRQSEIERLINGENNTNNMKIELKQIIDELTEAIRLPKGQKVSALVDDGQVVGWTIVNVFEDGTITPISDKKYNNIKELIEDYK